MKPCLNQDRKHGAVQVRFSYFGPFASQRMAPRNVCGGRNTGVLRCAQDDDLGDSAGMLTGENFAGADLVDDALDALWAVGIVLVGSVRVVLVAGVFGSALRLVVLHARVGG